MSQAMAAKLKRSLILHEGCKNFPYVDSFGNITVGIGYNLSARGLDNKWIADQFLDDIYYFYSRFIEYFRWFELLDEDRQIALIDMAFMGWKNFLTFQKMLAALAIQDYETAAFEMIDSKWARQVGARAHRVANVIITGEYDI